VPAYEQVSTAEDAALEIDHARTIGGGPPAPSRAFIRGER